MRDEQMANYWKIETLGRVVFWELSLLAIGQQNSAELSLVSFDGCSDLKHITARNLAHCKSVLCHAQLCLAKNQCLIDQ